MMGHASLRALLAFDEGAGSTARRARIAAHLRGCASCRARLTDLRRIRDDVREATSASAPDALAPILSRVAAGEPLILPVPGTATPAPARGRWSSSAAAIALLVCVGSAAGAVAGPPLIRWVQERIEDPPPLSAAPSVPAPVAGVEVLVADGGVTIELVDASAELTLRIDAASGDLLEVLGVGEAALARFGSGEGRVVVTGATRGELRIGVPRSGAPVHVVAAGRELLVIDPATLGTPVELRLGALESGAYR